MNSPNTHTETTPVNGDTLETGSASSAPATDPMQDFYQLQQQLFIYTLAVTGIIFISTWIGFGLNIALNYLLGAIAGVVYLKMLARDVERIGRQQERLSKTRLALFIGLIIVATRLKELQILPIFLGFLTFKVAIVLHTLQSLLIPDRQEVREPAKTDP
ncbi:ATP synthase subunit I [Oscillatoriales cyanobacterium USR001]|nr:ATP synthase subunit I [Oscillatoriales cyanobacterium USR001]